jgi:hypothetical protein
MTGVVYCLTNPAMRDYVKIGNTSDLEERLKSRDNTSVPLPFGRARSLSSAWRTRPVRTLCLATELADCPEQHWHDALLV